MSAIVRWCLHRTSVVLLATMLVLAGGAYGATQLKQQFFPDIDFPFLAAVIEAKGLSAEQVDEQLAPLTRQAAEQVTGADKVYSVSTPGESRTYVQMAFGTDTDTAEQEYEDALKSLDLPDGVGAVEFEGGFDEAPVFVFALTGDDLEKLTTQSRTWVTDIEELDGVARVDVSGGVTEQVDVEVNEDALTSGITPAAVASSIKGAQASSSAGFVADKDGRQVPVAVAGPGVANVNALKDVRVSGQKLSDVAKVSESSSLGLGVALTNGKPSISVSVLRTQDANEVDVVDDVEKILDDARDELGDENVVTIYENATPIRDSIHGLVLEGVLGSLFAVIVIFLFLRSFRATIITAVSIPTSLVFGLLAGWMLGLTINIITLAGLTIAIGRVIDDGIVVLENIHKHLERGETRYRAVVDGTSEVSRAIAASTLATAAVFLPIGLVGGFVAEIFLSFSIIVACALLASLVVAVTVIPVLAALVMRPKDALGHEGAGLQRIVTPATTFGLRHRWITLLSAIAVFVLTMGVVASGAVPTQFLPEAGTQQVFGSFQLPPGTEGEAARAAIEPLEKELIAIDGVEDAQVASGDASNNFGDPGLIGAASIFLNLEEDADADKIVKQVRSTMLEQFPNGEVAVQQLENGPPSGVFEASIEADSPDQLVAAGDRIVKLLNERDDILEASSTAAREQPQLVFQTKTDSGFAPDAVALGLTQLTAPVPAGTVGDAEITVRGPESVLSSQAAVLKLPASLFPMSLEAPGASTIEIRRANTTLGDIATVTTEQRPAIVQRGSSGKYSATVSGRIEGQDTAGTINEIKQDVKDLKLKNVDVVYEGDAEFVADMMKDLGLAMITAIILVYLVLVLTFGSLAQPLTILAPVLFSFIGSMLALVITGRALGLPAMIGQLLLIGIVVANSILLVDTALRLRRTMDRDDALLEAARMRVRPVLMTAAATIAALVPLALGISGEGGIISSSLGTVVIGGLLTATLLTLVIVPAVYTLFDRKRGPLGDRHSRAERDNGAPPANGTNSTNGGARGESLETPAG